MRIHTLVPLLALAIAPTLAQNIPALVLVYSATTAFRHDSIPTAIEALRNRGPSINVVFELTEDRNWFNNDNLRRYDAIAFLSTTGEVLNDAGKDALQGYLNQGGNFIGIHSASDTLVNTTFYAHDLGALFDYHPAVQNATVNVIDPSHPSTSMLPPQWQVHDEMYNFKSDPRSLGAVVILSADESSYTDEGPRQFDQGSPHPTAWFQDHGAGVQAGGTAGRSFYTSLGHLNETWQDDLFLAHVLGGITWALQANTTRAFNSSALVGNDKATQDPPISRTDSSGSVPTSPLPSDPITSSSPVSASQGVLAWLMGLLGAIALV